MPKIKLTVGSQLHNFVGMFDVDIFSTDGIVLFYKMCNITVVSENKFTIQQHISRDKNVCCNGTPPAKTNKQTSSQLQNMDTQGKYDPLSKFDLITPESPSLFGPITTYQNGNGAIRRFLRSPNLWDLVATP